MSEHSNSHLRDMSYLDWPEEQAGGDNKKVWREKDNGN